MLQRNRQIFALTLLWVGLTAGVSGAADEVPPAPPGTFSIVAFPDTQAYSAGQPEVFYAETQWVVDNVERQRIAFVTHLGDVVDRDVPVQWAVAVRAMARLDGKVPYGLSVGNHDMKCGKGDASLFSAMFPATHFTRRPWYGGHLDDNTNSYQYFEAEGLKFIMLHLECNAPDEVLEWAGKVLDENADHRAIISTHMFLGPRDRPKTAKDWYEAPKGIMQWKKCHGEAGNSPQQLWEKRFRKHKNVFLILCGDQSRTQAMHLALEGEHGNQVHACLSDYRGGYLRVYRFLPKKNRIRVMTYSATSRALCETTSVVKDEAKHQFTIPYAMTSP